MLTCQPDGSAVDGFGGGNAGGAPLVFSSRNCRENRRCAFAAVTHRSEATNESASAGRLGSCWSSISSGQWRERLPFGAESESVVRLLACVYRVMSKRLGDSRSSGEQWSRRLRVRLLLLGDSARPMRPA
jgi:hypothetical protein